VHGKLQLPPRAAELHAVDDRILLRHSIATGSMSDAAALAVGQSFIAAKASKPVPVPRSRMLREAKALSLHPLEREQTPGRGLVLARSERPAGIDLQRQRIAGTSLRCAGVWTKKRPARIGSSPCWLSVTQSCSSICSTSGSAPAAEGHERPQQT
jgi:hypothetical protein